MVQKKIDVERTNFLHVPRGHIWSSSSDAHQVDGIQNVISPKFHRFKIGCNSQNGHYHRVQRLMLSKGAKRGILDDITVIPNYF